MLPSVRFVRWTVFGSVLVAILVSVALAGRSPSSPQSFSALWGDGTVDTPWGPLGASDRDMLIKVRQANLWEGPTGEQAEQQAASPAVREVGGRLGLEHAQLDESLRVVADKLRVRLPSQPSDQQKVWMAEITGRSGADYDSTFVNLVRSAHGEVMPLVEGVRSGTQNELVRRFAIQASAFVGRHMDYLESTGLVDYSLFPPSTAPAARLVALGGYNVPITMVLFVVAVAVGAALLRGLGRSRSGRPGREPAGRWARLLTGLSRDRSTMPVTRVREAELVREAEPSTVTTAELIAVLNPPTLTDALRGRHEPASSADRPRRSSAVRMPRIPAQRGESPSGASSPDRGPSRLGRVSGDRRW